MPCRRLCASGASLVRPDGFEPPFTGLQPVVLPLDEGRMPRRCGPLAGDRFGVLMSMEPMRGFEPPSTSYKDAVLPLNYIGKWWSVQESNPYLVGASDTCSRYH